MRDERPRPGAPVSRRALIGLAVWSAPTVILASASPAHAASTSGDTPIAKLRIDPGYMMDNARKYDPATNSNRGPLRIYIRVRYDVDIQYWPTPDPASATVPWTVSMTGPRGPLTLTGAATISRGGYSQQIVWYPGENDYPIPAGTYTATLTIYGSDGSKTAATSILV